MLFGFSTSLIPRDVSYSSGYELTLSWFECGSSNQILNHSHHTKLLGDNACFTQYLYSKTELN